MVTVLPGPLLPQMAARWGLRDVQSGAFFAAVFAASTVGSIFSPHWLRRNLPLGYASMTVGVVLLMVAEETAPARLGHGQTDKYTMDIDDVRLGHGRRSASVSGQRIFVCQAGSSCVKPWVVG